MKKKYNLNKKGKMVWVAKKAFKKIFFLLFLFCYWLGFFFPFSLHIVYEKHFSIFFPSSFHIFTLLDKILKIILMWHGKLNYIYSGFRLLFCSSFILLSLMAFNAILSLHSLSLALYRYKSLHRLHLWIFLFNMLMLLKSFFRKGQVRF